MFLAIAVTIAVLTMAAFVWRGRRAKLAEAEKQARAREQAMSEEEIRQAQEQARLEEQTRQLRQLIEEVEAGVSRASWRLASNYDWVLIAQQSQDQNLVSSVHEARRTAQILTEYSSKRNWIQELFSAWSAAPDSLDRVKGWVEFVRIFHEMYEENRSRLAQELDYDDEAARSHFKGFIVKRYSELQRQAQTDASAFGRLRELILRTQRGRFTGDLAGPFRPLEFPPDWNDLVARHVQNPHFDDFLGLRQPCDLAIGQFRLMAAEALDHNDLTQAQIVLAYCNYGEQVRVEVGDYLAGQVAKLVAALTNAPR
ncbi:hypothetical protein KY386_00865 [Candidatus Parcubacteria bacterium]|nr:hypothetical protein [Candidatus Parcubacteria bacterium]